MYLQHILLNRDFHKRALLSVFDGVLTTGAGGLCGGALWLVAGKFGLPAVAVVAAAAATLLGCGLFLWVETFVAEPELPALDIEAEDVAACKEPL